MSFTFTCVNSTGWSCTTFLTYLHPIINIEITKREFWSEQGWNAKSTSFNCNVVDCFKALFYNCKISVWNIYNDNFQPLPVAITWEDAPTEQYPIRHSDYKVKCKVHANPAPIVDWFKNNEAISTSKSHFPPAIVSPCLWKTFSLWFLKQPSDTWSKQMVCWSGRCPRRTTASTRAGRSWWRPASTRSDTSRWRCTRRPLLMRWKCRPRRRSSRATREASLAWPRANPRPSTPGSRPTPGRNSQVEQGRIFRFLLL